MIKENQYINIRELLARVTAHPMLKKVDLEQAIRYTIDFISIVGCPKFFLDKEATVEIKDYKGLLPCDLVAINQVKDNKTCICLRSMSDTFSPREHHHPTEGTFKTQGNIIFTSFRTGECTISYKAIPTDKDGLPLLIDNSNFLKALELYIKKQVFTVLFDMGKLQAGILNNTQQEYYYAVAQCEKEFIMPSVSELQTITNIWNSLIPRVMEFDNGFRTAGDREYLINH